jgi:hypothetical protein
MKFDELTKIIKLKERFINELFIYFQSFLRNERENALLAVIEQTRKNVGIMSIS